jgi:cell division protein FtsA
MVPFLNSARAIIYQSMLDKIKSTAKTKLKSRKSKNNSGLDHVVALDIGTEYVKALIGRVQPDNKIDIVGVGRAHQSLSDMQAGAIANIGGVVSNCDAALTEAERNAGIDARHSVIGIAGELVKGVTVSVPYNRKHTDVPITVDEIEHMVKITQSRYAKQKAKEQLSLELGGKEVDVQLVNSALISMSIDGYVITNPVGFLGREITIHLYAAFAPMIHIGAIDKTAEELDLDLMAVAAEPFAVVRAAIGYDSDDSMNAVFIDVGGGTTDVAVVDQGGVQGTKSFGIGGRSFTRAISRDLDISFAEAENIKLNLGSIQSSEVQREQVNKALKKTLDVWMSGISLALEDFGGLDHLPNKVLLCGGGASLAMLVERLENEDWYRELPFSKKPHIRYIEPKEVKGIVDTTGAINDHEYITSMGLLRVGLDTLINQQPDSTGNVKKHLDRILKT